MRKIPLLLGILAIVALSTGAEASHFRGAASIPEIDANGLLTITTTSFWRKAAPSGAGTMSVSGVGNAAQFSTVTDQSDSRYAVVTQVHRIQLPGAGTYNISWGGCCRVAVGGVGNWNESNWTMNSAIVWDGQNATKPIDFSFASIQPEVLRGGFYSQPLGVVSPDGLGLSYNQNLNTNITFQPPGFLVHPVTGLMTIGNLSTPLYTDNLTLGGQNAGADAAFSGNIIAANGSFVEFDWMFDGVDQLSNRAPIIDDAMDMGPVGTVFNHTFTATDPDLDPLTWDPVLFAILGPPVNNLPVWNAATQQFTWNSAGSPIGNYIFQVRVADPGGLTDIGNLAIELKPGGIIPEPTTLGLFALGALGLAGVGIRRRRKKDRS